jgi:DNA-binding transcriptional LysR family regulator
LFPREIAPTLYDTIVDACRKAGFQPVIGQVAPHITSIVNLVAAELGVSLVPAAMMQLRVTGIVYRQIAGQSPTTRLALAYRRGETSPVVRNFVARAVSRCSQDYVRDGLSTEAANSAARPLPLRPKS